MATVNKNVKPLSEQQIATNNGYIGSNYQSGYGIGFGGNITGGFNSFNDSNALRNEIGRLDTVMSNRTKYGLDNTGYDSYYGKLTGAYQPFTDAQNKATNAQNTFNTQYAQNNETYDKYFGNFNESVAQAQAKADAAQAAFNASHSANTSAYNQAFEGYNGQIAQANADYYNGAGYKGYLDSMNQTVDSIASKYGFSFNRDAARQQAEAEAQALRNANADATRKNESANKTNTAAIDNNVMTAAEAMDRNYFQAMMGQQQNQVNGGLNAGIASDQDLRLQMARQAEMGGIYRDANTGKMVEQERFTNDQLRLAEQLGLIDQQAITKEGSSMRDWDMDMYNVISNDRNFYQGAANMEWGQSQDLVNQYFGQQDRLTDNYRDNRNFDYGASRDLVGDSYKDKDFAQGVFGQLTGDLFNKRDFEYGMSRDTIGDAYNERDFAQNAMNQTNANNQWQQGFDWTKAMDEAGLTGNYNGGRTLDGIASDLNQSQFDWNKQMDQANLNYNYATLDQRKAEFATEQEWRQYEFNNMSATQRANLQQNASQFGEEMAWRMFETEYNGNLQREMSKAELEAYTGTSSSSTTGSLGGLSQKYESNGNPATIARTKGDIGGASYGSYQLTTASGHAQKFANSYGGALAGKKAGTAAFDTAWKQEAQKNPTAFGAAQHNYIQTNHYEPAAAQFKKITGIDPAKQPQAIQDMIWSIGVQHGAGGAGTIFKNANINKALAAETIVKRVYGERMNVDKYFKSSPSNIRNSVKNRFQKEMQDALSMLSR